MNIHEHTTIALYDDSDEQMGNYTRGEEEFRLLDGSHIVAFNVTEAADLIAFLQRVRDMQGDNDADLPTAEEVRGIMKPEPQPVDLAKAKPGDICLRRNGERVKYDKRHASGEWPHVLAGLNYGDDGYFYKPSAPHPLDIIAVIPSDHSGPSGTACDTIAKEYAR